MTLYELRLAAAVLWTIACLLLVAAFFFAVWMQVREMLYWRRYRRNKRELQRLREETRRDA